MFLAACEQIISVTAYITQWELVRQRKEAEKKHIIKPNSWCLGKL